VVLQNKKLLVFPVLSFVFTMVILAFAISPVAFLKTGYGLGQAQHWKAVGESLFVANTVESARGSTTHVSPKPLAIAIAAGVYLLSMFLATFFNVAFFHQILEALRGRAVSIGAGFQFALSRIQAILLWSLFAGAIGLAIKALEERLDVLGKIVLRLVGTAWSVASVFVIPVLVVENEKNPFTILRKSASTLKKTWGESLAGYVGLQMSGLIVLLFTFLFLGGGIFASIALHTFWIFAAVAVIWLLTIIAFAYLTNVAGQVYRCALFVYASEGTIPQPYNNELLQMAWKMKE
jgi:hypothetical protein